MSRWKKWLLRTLPVAILVPVAGVLIDRYYARWQGQKRLAAVIANLDATEPGWRQEDLLAAREKDLPPNDKNLFVLTDRIHHELPSVYKDWQEQSKWRTTDDLNRLPRPADLAAARQAWTDCKVVIELARRARTMPRGGVRWVVPTNPLDTSLEHDQRLRNIGGLMNLDAIIAAADKRPDDAIAASQATLTAGRVIGDEPSLISMLVRIAMAAIAVIDLERTLAWSEPVAGLRELQLLMLAEADEPLLYYGLRGDRAMMDKLQERLDSGEMSIAKLSGQPGDPFSSASEWLYRKYLPDERATMLELLSRITAISNTPTPTWGAQFAAIQIPPKTPGTILVNLLTPAYEKVAEADRRGKARLRSAAVAIACERHRRATGKWPATLAELPKDLLPTGPARPV